MKLFHLTIDGQPTLETFSPVELIDTLLRICKVGGPQPTDVYTTEVK